MALHSDDLDGHDFKDIDARNKAFDILVAGELEKARATFMTPECIVALKELGLDFIQALYYPETPTAPAKLCFDLSDKQNKDQGCVYPDGSAVLESTYYWRLIARIDL